jgi:hypothetical protein
MGTSITKGWYYNTTKTKYNFGVYNSSATVVDIFDEDGLITPQKMDLSAVTVGTSTAGTLVTTGSTWLVHATAGQCAFKLLCSSTATTGDYATMRIRGRADAVSSGGVEGINASASANIANYTNLCAGYFAAQPMAINSTAAAGIITAVHAVVDRTGTSSGHTWVAWIDTHQETKSGAGDYLVRLSHNGTAANDGVFTVYNGGRMPILFNFEDAAGCLRDTDATLTVQSGAIAVKTPAGTKYIPLYNAAA